MKANGSAFLKPQAPDHVALLDPEPRLAPVKSIPTFAVILRCIHCRGDDQRDALAELERRRGWLTDEQKRQAGLLVEQQ